MSRYDQVYLVLRQRQLEDVALPAGICLKQRCGNDNV